jgi:hypothetical protein
MAKIERLEPKERENGTFFTTAEDMVKRINALIDAHNEREEKVTKRLR